MPDLSVVFSALGNPARLSIVDHLRRRGEQPVAALKARSGLSGPALSRHLKRLREAGVLQVRGDAQQRLYSIRPKALRALADWAEDRPQSRGSGLDRLDALLKKARR